MDAFSLKELGPFKVERTEDWGNDPDSSYSEMILVKGSKIGPPMFLVLSHLYKYSETELGIYLKDHKNLWRALEKLLNEEIDIHEAELMIHFPISTFPKVAQIVPFVRKTIRKTPLTDQERERASHLRSYRKDIMKQNDKISDLRGSNGIIALDSFLKMKREIKRAPAPAGTCKEYPHSKEVRND